MCFPGFCGHAHRIRADKAEDCRGSARRVWIGGGRAELGVISLALSLPEVFFLT